MTSLALHVSSALSLKHQRDSTPVWHLQCPVRPNGLLNDVRDSEECLFHNVVTDRRTGDRCVIYKMDDLVLNQVIRSRLIALGRRLLIPSASVGTCALLLARLGVICQDASSSKCSCIAVFPDGEPTSPPGNDSPT